MQMPREATAYISAVGFLEVQLTQLGAKESTNKYSTFSFWGRGPPFVFWGSLWLGVLGCFREGAPRSSGTAANEEVVVVLLVLTLVLVAVDVAVAVDVVLCCCFCCDSTFFFDWTAFGQNFMTGKNQHFLRRRCE